MRYGDTRWVHAILSLQAAAVSRVAAWRSFLPPVGQGWAATRRDLLRRLAKRAITEEGIDHAACKPALTEYRRIRARPRRGH